MGLSAHLKIWIPQHVSYFWTAFLLTNFDKTTARKFSRWFRQPTRLHFSTNSNLLCSFRCSRPSNGTDFPRSKIWNRSEVGIKSNSQVSIRYKLIITIGELRIGCPRNTNHVCPSQSTFNLHFSHCIGSFIPSKSVSRDFFEPELRSWFQQSNEKDRDGFPRWRWERRSSRFENQSISLSIWMMLTVSQHLTMIPRQSRSTRHQIPAVSCHQQIESSLLTTGHLKA